MKRPDWMDRAYGAALDEGVEISRCAPGAERRPPAVFLSDRFAEVFDWDGLERRAKGCEWYVMLTAPRWEFHCWLGVWRMGFDAFVPHEQFWRRANRYHKRKRRVSNPLMPRYLFAGFPKGTPPPWYHLMNIDRVQGVIATGGRPIPVPVVEVEKLAALGGANHFRAPEYQKWMRTHGEFDVGDEVEVVEGPFFSHRAKVRNISENCARVLLRLFGDEREVEMPLDALELIR